VRAVLRNASGDVKIASLVRQARELNDPEAALQAIREAVRYGLWLVPRQPRQPSMGWSREHLTNMHRVAALRFLAYLGWKEAEGLLAALPLGDPEFDIHQASSRRHAREGQPAYWPSHLQEGTPEHTEAMRAHKAYFRRVIPPKAFKDIGEEVAAEIGADMLAAAVRPALLLTLPLFVSHGIDPSILPPGEGRMVLALDQKGEGWFGRDAMSEACWAWYSYLNSSERHKSDRASELARSLRSAISALHFMCLQERYPPHAGLPPSWREDSETACRRVANKIAKRAMLPAAAIAAAGTLA